MDNAIDILTCSGPGEFVDRLIKHMVRESMPDKFDDTVPDEYSQYDNADGVRGQFEVFIPHWFPNATEHELRDAISRIVYFLTH